MTTADAAHQIGATKHIPPQLVALRESFQKTLAKVPQAQFPVLVGK